jgi:hypothetical protein
MNDFQIRKSERRRLEADLAARHRLQSVSEIDELALRIEDAIAEIALDLQYEAGRPASDPPSQKRMDWRDRANRALARMEFALQQVLKCRELLERIGQSN